MIPDLHKRLATELGNLSSDLTSKAIRPMIRILGTLIAFKLEYGHELMYDNKFETFVLTVLYQP
jgi:hypothetical protein